MVPRTGFVLRLESFLNLGLNRSGELCTIYLYEVVSLQQVIRVKKLPPPALELPAHLFLGLEESSLKYYVRRNFSARILAQFQIVGVRNQPSLFRVI